MGGARFFILGYGNPLRGDDGFGPRVAEKIAALHLPDVEVLTCLQLTPELAEPLSRAALAVFADATAGRTPERLTCRPIEAAAKPPGAFTHRVDPGGLLWLARELYGACPPAWAVSAAAEDFEFGAPLSPEMEAAVDAAAAMILDRLSAAR